MKSPRTFPHTGYGHFLSRLTLCLSLLGALLIGLGLDIAEAQSLRQAPVTLSVKYYDQTQAGLNSAKVYKTSTTNQIFSAAPELTGKKLLCVFEGATGVSLGAATYQHYQNTSELFFQVGASLTAPAQLDFNSRIKMTTRASDSGAPIIFADGKPEQTLPDAATFPYKRGVMTQVRLVDLKIFDENGGTVGDFTGTLSLTFDLQSYNPLQEFPDAGEPMEVWVPRATTARLTGTYQPTGMLEASPAVLTLTLGAFNSPIVDGNPAVLRPPTMVFSQSSRPIVYLNSDPANPVTPSINATVKVLPGVQDGGAVVYEWIKDGTVLATDTVTASLAAGALITYTPAAGANFDSGRYTLKYHYENGDLSSASSQQEFIVVDHAAPTITAQPVAPAPTDADIAGSTVSFSVSAEGSDSGQYTFQWYKRKSGFREGDTPLRVPNDYAGENGAVLSTAASIETPVASGIYQSTLTISNITYADAGDYYAVVTSPLTDETVTSGTVHFSPSTAPHILAQPGGDAWVEAGTMYVSMTQSLSLNVVAAGPSLGGTLAYQWYKNGSAIRGATLSTYVEARVKPSLDPIFNPVTSPNGDGVKADMYQVRVSNKYGSVLSNRSYVKVVPEFMLHEVVPIGRTSIWMSKYETTMAQWKNFVSDTGWKKSSYWRTATTAPTQVSNVDYTSASWPRNPSDAYPVAMISWEEAQDYCAWLSSKSGMKWRLPTQAEWTAAVGPNKYPWGNTWPPSETDGNYGTSAAQPVGSSSSFNYGLYDMGGNVAEWMQDAGTPNASSSTLRMTRGGSFVDIVSDLTLSSRNLNRSYKTTFRAKDIGFRVVLELPTTLTP